MTRPTRHTLATIAILAALIGAAVAQPPVSVGLAMWQAGYRATIAKGDGWFATREVAHGTINPSSALLCVRPCEGGRWGFDRNTKGYMVGPEGTSRDQVQAALDSGCLVLPGIPAGYEVTQLDYLDLMYLRHGSTSWYAARVQPCTKVANPQPTPPPATPTPTPVATPVATPQPTPAATPCRECPPLPPPCEACPVYERADLTDLTAKLRTALVAVERIGTSWATWPKWRRQRALDTATESIREVETGLGEREVYEKPPSSGVDPVVTTLDAETPVPCAEVPAGVAVNEGDCEGGVE